jgi:hypothetical protein
MGFFDRREHLFYKRFQLNNNWTQEWTTTGLPLEAAYNTNMNVTFRNNWGWHMGATVGQLGTTYDDRAARGGPAVRQGMYVSPWLSIGGDDRRAVVPNMNFNYTRSEEGRNSHWNVSPEVDYKIAGRFSSAFSVGWSRNIADNQWYGNFSRDDGTHYTFAHLDQTTTSATVRLNYTFTPSVSLQGYVQPFVSKGTYTDVRQLSATPRAASYDDRYAPFADTSITNAPGGFNFKQLQSNLVFRWEYKPGSTLFLVWNEGRQGSGDAAGTRNFREEVDQLLRLHPANTFLIKVSYWLNR